MMDQVLWGKICSDQNLKLAWNKVKENKGSPGVDSITLEEFEKNLDDNLNLLQKELENGDFKPLPVLRFYLDKEDGTSRPIGIPPVRDRVVQQALHSVLSPIFEEEFLDCSFAYRPGRSALEAIDKVEALINEGTKWVLDGDIEKFFDTIDHDLLLSFVSGRVSEDSILKLIRKFLKTGFFDNMSIHEEYSGITQGSAISPLLANIYLHNFDVEINVRGYHLIRYADDFLILEDSQERIGKALADTAVILRELKLNLNEKKTKILPVAEGFVFLGYYIDDKGKGPGKKAINAINRKLKEINQANRNKKRKISESIGDLKESIRGWSSYFHTCRGIEPQDPLILIALIEMSVKLGDEDNAKKLLGKRTDFTIDQADIYSRLGHVAQTLGLREAALDNFSQALALDADHFQAKDSLKQLQLVDEDIYSSIERLKKLIHFCPDLAQPYRDLAYCYAELGEYGQAQESYQQALKLEMEAIPEEKPITPVPQSVEVQELIFSDEDVSIYSSLFKGKDGFFARQWVNEKGRRGFALVPHSLDPEDITHHLSGNETLGLYLLNVENRVCLAVIDIDIDKKALLEYANDEKETGRLHNLTHKDAVMIAGVCDDLKIPVVIEDSGYKGRHLWFFFTDPIPAKLARIFLKFIIEKAGKPSGGIHWEIFPNIDKVRGKGFGPLIKLPLGIHKRTNRRCLLLDREGNPLPEQMAVLPQIKHITRQTLEELLLTYTVKPKASPLKDTKEESPLVENLLSGCKVINYLVNKARDTHYLNNSERITLLYTLGHLGSEGKDFLHKVISNCINYDYDYTEKQIRKMKSSPISCPKIREKHEDFALDLGCNCNFRIPYKGYPSPVLHAFKQPRTWPFQSPPLNEKSTINQDNSTIPESISGDLKKYIELKKQLGGVEKSIHRIEEGMSSYFDKAGTESIITEYGLLERKRKAGNKFEWTIKL